MDKKKSHFFSCFGRAPLPRAASDRHEQGLSPSCDDLLSLGACVDSFIRSLHRRSPPTPCIQMLRCSRYSVCVRYVIPSAARRFRVLRCFLANTVFHIVRQSFRALTTYSLAKHVVRIDRPSRCVRHFWASLLASFSSQIPILPRCFTSNFSATAVTILRVHSVDQSPS